MTRRRLAVLTYAQIQAARLESNYEDIVESFSECNENNWIPRRGSAIFHALRYPSAEQV